jgi:hypothetical protein
MLEIQIFHKIDKVSFGQQAVFLGCKQVVDMPNNASVMSQTPGPQNILACALYARFKASSREDQGHMH